MIKVGITGGIGSGKSTVCKVFAILGVPVYSSDAAARLVLDDPAVIAQIRDLGGDGVITADGKVERKKLGDVVFNDKQKLEHLNNIVHPAVAKHFEAWCEKQINAPYILKEAAILFESGAYKQTDKIITVTAPLELKIARTMQRDGYSRKEVEERINNQLSDEEKIKRSDYVLLNDEIQLLIPQVVSIHGMLLLL